MKVEGIDSEETIYTQRKDLLYFEPADCLQHGPWHDRRCDYPSVIE